MKQRGDAALTYVRVHWFGILFAALTIALYARNLIGLATTPPGSYVDESSIGYNAWAIAHSGVDEHGYSWPLYFEAFGEYKNPVYVYAAALVVKLGGLSMYTVRLPAAVFGLIAAVAIALTVRVLTKSRAATLVTLVVAGFTPWLTQESRLGFEVISMVASLSVMLWCLAEANERDSWRWYVAAGVAAAVSIYAYSTGRLEVALFSVACLIAFARPWRPKWWAAIPPVVIGYGVLGIWALRHPGALTARYDIISITQDHTTGATLPIGTIIPTFLANFVTYFGKEFLFVTGDANVRHNTQWGGELLWISLPLLVAAVIWLVRNRRHPMTRFLVLGLLLAPVGAALTDDGTPHSLRSAAMLPFLLVLCGLGAAALCDIVGDLVRKRKRPAIVEVRARAAVTVAVVAITALSGISYLHDMYANYPARAEAWFDVGEQQALLAAHDAANGSTVYLLQNVWLDQPYIEAAMVLTPPPPTQAADDTTTVLLSEMGMESVPALDRAARVGSIVVVAQADSTVPDGANLIYSNDYARVYRIIAPPPP